MAAPVGDFLGIYCHIFFEEGSNPPREGSITLELYDKNTQELILTASAGTYAQNGQIIQDYWYGTYDEINGDIWVLANRYGYTGVYQNIEWRLANSYTNYEIVNIEYFLETSDTGYGTQYNNNANITLRCLDTKINNIDVDDLIINNQRIQQVYLNNKKVYGMKPIAIKLEYENPSTTFCAVSFSGLDQAIIDDMYISARTEQTTDLGYGYSYYLHQTLSFGNVVQFGHYKIFLNDVEIDDKVAEKDTVILTADKCKTYNIKPKDIVKLYFYAPLISFTIGGTSYKAEYNMTWEAWVNSTYNTDGYKVAGNYILNADSKRVGTTLKTDIIQSGTAYTISSSPIPV